MNNTIIIVLVAIIVIASAAFFAIKNSKKPEAPVKGGGDIGLDQPTTKIPGKGNRYK